MAVASTTSTTWRGIHVLPTKIADTRPAREASSSRLVGAAAGSVRATCQEYVARVPSAPAVPESWRATAQGGVPNLRGHGICGLPLTSASPVIRWCIASVSVVKRSRSAVSPATRPRAGQAAALEQLAVLRVAEDPGHHHRRGPARPLVGLHEQLPGGRRVRHRPTLRLTRADTSRYASSGETGSQPERRPRGRRRVAGRAAGPARDGRRTSGGLRCSRRSRVSRRQNVTSGCWRTQYAAASWPRSRHARHDLLGEDALGHEQPAARRGRGPGCRSGRPGRCRRPAPRRCPSRHSRSMAASASSGSQESGWSQSTRPAFAPAAIRGSVGSPPFL